MVKLIPDGFKVFHIPKDEIDGLVNVYVLGLPGDVKKFCHKFDIDYSKTKL